MYKWDFIFKVLNWFIPKVLTGLQTLTNVYLRIKNRNQPKENYKAEECALFLHVYTLYQKRFVAYLDVVDLVRLKKDLEDNCVKLFGKHTD